MQSNMNIKYEPAFITERPRDLSFSKNCCLQNAHVAAYADVLRSSSHIPPPDEDVHQRNF